MTPVRSASTTPLIEIGVLAAIYLVILWGLGPHMGEGPVVVAAYWALVVLGAAVMARSLWRAPPPRNLPVSAVWLPYAAWTATAAAVLILIAAWRNPEALGRIDPGLLALKFGGYLVFALIQATGFFAFLHSRIMRILADRPGLSPRVRVALAAAVTAAVFSLCHAPNPPMMLLTLAGGLGWALIHSARPNLWLLALSHAVLGTIVHRVLLLNTRIGPFYAHPDLHILQQAIPGLRLVFGNLF